MSINADTVCRNLGEMLKLRWPALHAIKLYCGTKYARIAPPNKLTDSYTRCLAKAQPCLKIHESDTHIPTIYYYITDVYPVLIHWWAVYAIVILFRSTACFITLLSYTQHFYIAELYPILTHCLGLPNFITLLR